MNEQELFDIVRRCLLPDLERSRDTYSTWDAVSADKKYLIELKCRGAHYRDLLLEKKKFDALCARAAARGLIPVYINSTPRGIYAWRLDKLDQAWETNKNCPVNTAFGGQGNRIAKTVTYLPTTGPKVNAFELPRPGDDTLTKRV